MFLVPIFGNIIYFLSVYVAYDRWRVVLIYVYAHENLHQQKKVPYFFFAGLKITHIIYTYILEARYIAYTQYNKTEIYTNPKSLYKIKLYYKLYNVYSHIYTEKKLFTKLPINYPMRLIIFYKSVQFNKHKL